MRRVEDLGFSVMTSYGAKLTLVEGVTIGLGAALATGAALLASRSLAEEEKNPSVEEIEDRVVELSKDPKLLEAIQLTPETAELEPYWDERQGSKQLVKRDRLRAVADFMMRTGASVEEVEKLGRLGALDVMLKPRWGGGYAVIDGRVKPRWDQLEYDLLVSLAGADDRIVKLAGRALHESDPYIIERYLQIPSDAADEIFDIIEAAGEMQPQSTPADFTLDRAIRWRDRGGTAADVEKFGYWLYTNADADLRSPASRALWMKAIDHFGAGSLASLGMSLDTSDIEELMGLGIERIPAKGYEIYVHSKPDDYGRDWEKFGEDVKLYEQMPREMLDQIGVPISDQIALWKVAKNDDELKSAIFGAAAVAEAIPSVEMSYALEKLVGYELSTYVSAGEYTKGVLKALKSGGLKKFDATMRSGDGLASAIYADLLMTYVTNLDKVKSWESKGDLMEKLAVLSGLSASPHARPPSTSDKGLHRVRDRLAQRDPEWAIAEYPAEYKRGRRIAKFLDQITDYIEGLVRNGETVVVHGRDGELLYDMLRRRPSFDSSRVRYALTSRPMTTFAKAIPDRYRDYLGRMVPKGAVHIDTGFEGTIPRWFDQKGFEIKSIRMVSANRPDEQIPVQMDLDPVKRRDIVLSDLEHSSQRLENPKTYSPGEPERGVQPSGGFLDLEYSYAAPGYHARAYGVFDELGLPRRASTPRTRFEERMRLRIAPEVEEGEGEEEAVLEPKVVLKVK